jgi:hypothetical protein
MEEDPLEHYVGGGPDLHAMVLLIPEGCLLTVSIQSEVPEYDIR